MKNMKRFAALALMLLCTFSLSAKTRISVKELPQSAQTFLTKYFDKLKVIMVEKDIDDGRVDYEVNLSSHTEVDFDSDGNWKEVSGKVPAQIIPSQIAKSVKENYKNRRIVKIEKEHGGGYEIELNNGREIHYDRNFNVIRM